MKQFLLVISICFTLCSSLSFSWSQAVLSEKAYYELILLNHPLVKQAGIKPLMGESQLMKAKGGFDPKMFSQLDRKNYNGVTNYQKVNAGLSIPTWYGIQVKSGFESNSGPYLSSEDKTPAGGLWYGGVSVNLGQGMMLSLIHI